MKTFIILTVLLFGFNFLILSQQNSNIQGDTATCSSNEESALARISIDYITFRLKVNDFFASKYPAINQALTFNKARTPVRIVLTEQEEQDEQESDLSASASMPSRTTEYIIRTIKPDPAIDYKLVVVKPDSSADYKLRVVNPSPILSRNTSAIIP